jgi:hypothetical protein
MHKNRQLRRLRRLLLPGMLPAAVILAVLVATAGVGWKIDHARAVYYSQVYVIFSMPAPGVDAGPARDFSPGLIDAAGVVGLMTDARSGAAPVSDGVTIVSQGIRDGFSVRLPNDGGQWSNVFDRPELDVQVAGASPDEVTAKMKSVLAGIYAGLARDQQAMGVNAANRITTQLSPPSIDVYRASGSRIRALSATLFLGLCLAFSLARLVQRLSPKRTPDSGLRGQSRAAVLVPAA